MAGRFSIEAMFKANDQLSSVVGRISGRLDKLTRRVAPLSAGLGKLNAITDKAFAGAAKAGTALAAAGATVGASLTAAMMPGANFEEAIASVGAVSLMTRDQVADLEAKARELGRTTKFSATEVAKGMETMGRAGFTNAEVIAGIAPMLSAAAAEGAEFEPVAEVVSSVIKGMGLAMSETGRVADVLTLASAKTKSSILSLGESIATTASTARQFNVPFEEVTAAAALLQDVGLDASVAGSAINTMLTNLANPTKEVTAKMKKLGISFQDAQGNMLPFKEVLANFSKGAENSKGNMAQVALFAELVGLRGEKAAGNLKDLFRSGKFGDLVADLQNAKGSAEQMAKLRLQNVKGDLTLLWNRIQDLAISVYDLAKGPIKEVVAGAGDWLEKNRSLIASGFKEFLDQGVPIAREFAIGIADGAKAVAGMAREVAFLAAPFEAAFGKESEGRLRNIRDTAKLIVEVTAGFVVYAAVVKGASLMTFLFAGVLKITRGAIWLFNIGLKAARGALVLYEFWSKAGAGGALALQFATHLATLELVAQRGAALLAVFGIKGIGVASLGASLGLSGMAAAAAGAILPLALLYVAYRMITDAVKDLLKQTQGLEGVWEGVKSLFTEGSFFEGVNAYQNKLAKGAAAQSDQKASLGEIRSGGKATGDLFSLFNEELGGANVNLDELTKGMSGMGSSSVDVTKQMAQLDEMLKTLGQDAAALGGPAAMPNSSQAAPPSQMVSPQERVARSVAETKTTTVEKQEVQLKLPPGMTADVKKPPGSKGGLSVTPSGGM